MYSKKQRSLGKSLFHEQVERLPNMSLLPAVNEHYRWVEIREAVLVLIKGINLSSLHRQPKQSDFL